MIQSKVKLSHISIDELLEEVCDEYPDASYDYKKHLVQISEANHTVGYIRIPLHLSIDSSLTIADEETTVLYLTIESGNAAICIMQGTHQVFHTTFSSYMTRKKQGFSQIKYLNKKGKSRAGSRVRLASTLDFFENINATLTDLLETFEVERIALDCNKTLIPYLYQSSVACPFDKKDTRLYKIPLHIPQSNFTNLKSTIKKLESPVLFCNEASQTSLEYFFGGLN
ncbi:hypothetical protein SAMN04488028_101275 [Reichenbachiella agariperforans]|uniref:VLRF1 domain-containing protein n=1 Tax=Reichenbachiella agariperforans TaxID=156994 RepID=A0A1M6JPN4_REIAG|nr:hypothetical protein [Reichenbachiella agariperforans]SHJ48707.1 hypothetical protein SAMN04488028_101275 [Reichenbachiella agariperforans]